MSETRQRPWSAAQQSALVHAHAQPTVPHTPIHLVAALDPCGVIGHENSLPWHLPDDLRHFQKLTTGQIVLMGRRTFLSIGRPLPRRRNLVLTRNPQWSAPAGVEVYDSLDAALAAAGTEPVFIIGGADVFAAALPLACQLHLTRVHKHHAGDVYFPSIGPEWAVTWEEEHPADDRHASAFTLQRLERLERLEHPEHRE